MNKKIAFLLVLAMTLTAMLGLAPVASAEESATPSQEIAYFNISLKVGATLLFAVPADGYTTNPDGTVDNLKLLVIKDSDFKGIVTAGVGEIIESAGKLEINGKTYIIFSYSGLAANEMCDTVYAGTVLVNERGYRTYADLKPFSLTSFAKQYNGEKVALVDAMLNYGDAAVDYQTNADVKANYLPSEMKSSDLYTIKVKRVVDGTPIDDEFVLTQFAKAGDVTLAAPPVNGADFASWSGAEVVDGKVTVASNLELVANYTGNSGKVNYALDLSKYAVGTYKGSTGSSSTTFDNNCAIGNDWSTTNTRTKYEYSRFELCEDSGVKYIKYAHNGAGELKLGNSWVGTGIGESLDFTFEINVKAGANNTFPTTVFRVDRDGSPTGGTGGTSPNLIRLEADGDIVLYDYDYGKSVVIGKGDSTKFQKITVVFDASEGTFSAYVDGEFKATTNATFNVDRLYGCHEHVSNKNSRLRMTAYGGYNGSNWITVDGVPTALIESGVFTVTQNEKGSYIQDKVTGLYRQVDANNPVDVETYADATRYSVKFIDTDLEASRAAVEEYILANQYFFFGEVKLVVGDTMSN